MTTATIVTTANESECGVRHEFSVDGEWVDGSFITAMACPCTWSIVETCTLDGAPALWQVSAEGVVFTLI